MSQNRVAKQYQDRTGPVFAAAMKIPAERREEPGVCGEWSIKDLLGHLAYWDEVRIARLEAEAAGRSFEEDEREEDVINAEQAQARAGRSWDEIVDELTTTRDRLTDLLGKPTKLDMYHAGEHWLKHKRDIDSWLDLNLPASTGGGAG